MAVCIAFPAAAHHILGVPHYAYDELYPQTPVLTYKANLHTYRIEMTAYPGKPEPGERTSIHVYILNTETGMIHDGDVTLTITRDRALLPEPVVYGPIEAEVEEAMFKFFPNFERTGNYSLELSFEGSDDEWIIELPMQVGEPRSPWLAIGAGGATLLALLIGLRAFRIKKKRAERVSSAVPLPEAEPVETSDQDLRPEQI